MKKVWLVGLMLAVAGLSYGQDSLNHTGQLSRVQFDAALDAVVNGTGTWNTVTGKVTQSEFDGTNIAFNAALGTKVSTNGVLSVLGGGSGTTYLQRDGTWSTPSGTGNLSSNDVGGAAFLNVGANDFDLVNNTNLNQTLSDLAIDTDTLVAETALRISDDPDNIEQRSFAFAGGSLAGKIRLGKNEFGDSVHVGVYPSQSQGYGNVESPPLLSDLPNGVSTNIADSRSDIYVSWKGDNGAWKMSTNLYKTAAVPPELFGSVLLADSLGLPVEVSKCAIGGQPISKFQQDAATNDYWTWFGDAYTNTITAKPNAGKLDVIWYCHGHSGESGNYLADMSKIIAALKATFGTTNTFVVLAGLGPGSPANSAEVNAAMISYASTNLNAIYFASDDLSVHDGIHFDSVSQKERGIRYANATINLLSGVTVDGYFDVNGEFAANKVSSRGDVVAIGKQTRQGTGEMLRGGSPYSYTEVYSPSTSEMQLNEVTSFTSILSGHVGWRVKGVVTGGPNTTYMASVKLVDSAGYSVNNTTATIHLNGCGSSGVWKQNSWGALFNAYAGGAYYYTLYGEPVKSSEDTFSWRVNLNENIDIYAGDILECGSGGQHFTASKDNGNTNYFMVRSFYDDNFTASSGYPAFDTDTPVIVLSGGTLTTNATAAVTTTTAPADYRNMVYAADDGWYIIPEVYSIMFYEIYGKDSDTAWTYEEGD